MWDSFRKYMCEDLDNVDRNRVQNLFEIQLYMNLII